MRVREASAPLARRARPETEAGNAPICLAAIVCGAIGAQLLTQVYGWLIFPAIPLFDRPSWQCVKIS